jgi:outer membrane immunogenic protein
MRRVMLATAMLGMAAGAQAADMPDFLRGSVGYSPTVNWRGFYVGGQAAWAYSAQTLTRMDPTVFPSTIAGHVVAEIPGLSAPNAFGTSWQGTTGGGAFAGYNWQWDDVILGAEMSYLHGDFGGGVSATRQFGVSAQLSDGLFHEPRVTSTSSISITDYATFRARAAYAYGCFLPYAFGGFTFGYANVTTTARVDDFGSATASGPFSPLPTLVGSSTGFNHLVYGYTAGLGVDINLIGAWFMRAEWEYVRFTTTVDINVNSIRAGLGYKF